MNEFATEIATSAAFYHYVAPNLGAVIAVFWIGIAGLAYVAARCLGEGFMKGKRYRFNSRALRERNETEGQNLPPLF